MGVANRLLSPMKLNSSFLNSPAPLSTYGGIHLTHLMRLAFISRGDLAARFSLSTKFDRTVYLLWYLLNAKEFFNHSEHWRLQPSWQLLSRPAPGFGNPEDSPLTLLQAALWFALPVPKIFDLSIAEDRLKVEMAVSAWPKGDSGIPSVPISNQSRLSAQMPEPSLQSFLSVFQSKHITVFQYVIWQLRPDLQNAFPLENKEGRQGLLNWFAVHAPNELDLSHVDAKIAPNLKANTEASLPIRPGNRNGKSQALRPFGLNQIGSVKGSSGMARQGQVTAMAAQAVGIPVGFIDVGTHISDPIEPRVDGNMVCKSPQFFLNVSTYNLDGLPNFIGCLKPEELDETYNVFYGNWEYPDLPAATKHLLNAFDEVWAPSQFSFEQYSRSLKVPVFYVPMAVTVSPSEGMDRTDFQLPTKSFIFLFTFDYFSWVSRKHPRAAVDAFLLAFPLGNEPVSLVIKTKNVHSNDHDNILEWEAVKNLAASDPRIRVIEKEMEDHAVHDLMRCCDAYVSLHRAEGFGFSVAEAMLLGKPAICTNYSGNTEFTLAENSLPVNYDLVPVDSEDVKKLGLETVWAEPDVDHAAAQMRALFHSETLYKNLSRAGANFIAERYSLESVGQKIKERLETIYRKLETD